MQPDIDVQSTDDMSTAGGVLIKRAQQMGDRMHQLMKTVNGLGWDSAGQQAFLDITVQFDRANKDLQRMLHEVGRGVQHVAKRTEETEAGIAGAWNGGFGPSGSV
jgi:uncharacterized protein YukE